MCLYKLIYKHFLCPSLHLFQNFFYPSSLLTINDFFPSYTTDENSVSASESIAFAQLAISLGVRGVTVVAASGDDGANSVYARGSFVSHCTLLL